ncbi:MAG: GerW family sporulation protein [Oscillospiraceae bacterium]|nr:GerW family sporulation protein [Oscillospiraceae bacterium]MDY5095740.1 GerW family sporulation protein [Oscillospiraceae bacterium]
MAEHPINGLMGVTMDKIRELVNSDTIIGEPVSLPDGTTILPVSRVTFGVATGGSDFAAKQSKELFGGGSGAGVTVAPVAFLVVKDGNVRTIQLADPNNSLERAITMLPELVDKLAALLKKEKPEAQAPAEDGPDAP